MTQILNSNRNKRVAYLDLLRILAIFAVIFQHFCPGYYNADDFNKNAVNIMVSLTDWCVPVFVMISGALLLNPQKEFSVKRFFKKNVLRIFVALCFWSIIYGVYYNISHFGSDWKLTSLFIPIFVKRLPWYHLWFVYMILALYLLIPIIRIFLKNATQKQIQYFILLAVLASSIEYWNVFMPTLNFSLSEMGGYVGYLVIGYYLNRFELTNRSRKIIYLSALLSAIWIVALNWVNGVPPHTYPSYTSPFVMVISIAVFLLFKNNCQIRPNSHIARLSNLVFGVYLVHDLFIQFFSNIIPKEWGSSALVFVPIAAIAVFICSAIVSFVISKIPVVGKYIT